MLRALFADIVEFHEFFQLSGPPNPGPLPHKISDFRCKFMLEEYCEYIDSVRANDLEGQLDALVDLVYVALGTAYLHGFNFEEAWKRVHEANMKKIRAQTEHDSKRGSSFDVVKPEGWTPPDLSDLVK